MNAFLKRVGLVALAVSIFSTSANAAKTFDFNISETTLVEALVEFAKITDSEYVAPVALLEGKNVSKVQGSLSAEQALKNLLAGSHLTFVRTSSGRYIIRLKPKPSIKAPVLDQLEEVVVSAQKRIQLRQDVPMQVSFYDGQQISELGLSNLEDLDQLLPSFYCHGAISSASQGVCLRGVGSGAIGGGMEQSVGTMIDGISAGPSGGGLQELWDVDRVEVLQGPQGTLFGKNASAGLIHYLTRDPDEEFSAYLNSRHNFDTEATRYESAVNLPIKENLKSRISGFYFDQDNPDSKAKESWGLRGKLHYDFGNNWLKLSSSADVSDKFCCVDSKDLPEDAPEVDHNGEAPGDNPNFQFLLEDIRSEISAIELGREFDSGHQIKSISGLRTWEYHAGNHETLDVPSFGVIDSKQDMEVRSQEFQWLSPDNGEWEYVLGAYYYYQNIFSRDYYEFGFRDDEEDSPTTGESTVELESYALFAHSTVHLGDQWSVIGGLRYVYDDASATGQFLWQSDDYREGPQNTIFVSDNELVGALGLQYLPNDDHRFYLGLSNGYKGSALDNSLTSPLYGLADEDGEIANPEEAILNPEKVMTYELGTKNYFYDRRFLFNVSTFHSDYRDFQASAVERGEEFRFINAGDVTSYGAEIELQAKLWKGASLSGTIIWLDVDYNKFGDSSCGGQGGPGDDRPRDEDGGDNRPPPRDGNNDGNRPPPRGGNNDGNRPPRDGDGGRGPGGGGDDCGLIDNSQWRYFAQFEQFFDTKLGTATFQLRYSWKDDLFFDRALGPVVEREEQSAYGLLDLRLGLESHRGWSVSAFVNNVLDQEYRKHLINPPIWRSPIQSYQGDGRNFGVEVNVYFE